MRTTRLSRIAATVAVVMTASVISALVLATPAQAAPQSVVCGATLTEDAVLTANLHCRSGNGLTLNPGVTFDLGGFAFTSTGIGTAITASEQATIVNGTIRDWETSISFVGVDADPWLPLTLTGLTVVRGKILMESSVTNIDSSVLRSAPVFPYSTTLTVTNSTLKSSSLAPNGELNVIKVFDSSIVGGGVGLEENNIVSISGTVMDGTGFAGSPTCTTATITNTTVKRYVSPISSRCGQGLTVVDSTFKNNVNGAILADATITGSTFRNNGNAVVGDVLTISGSTFTGNTTAVTVNLPDQSSITGSAFHNNTASGIYTDGQGLSVGSNTAVNNGQYGIYANGAVDLGGNVARKNGVADCVGLICALR